MPAHARVVALDEHGQRLNSEGLAQQLSDWREQADPVVFLIGGPDGLDADLKREARLLLRLSDFTLPHGMARVLLAEQLYRAWSIGSGHPYHRGLTHEAGCCAAPVALHGRCAPTCLAIGRRRFQSV